MIAATRRWLRRNRTGIAIGAGVLGVGYLAGQYVVGRISEARERMNSKRIAKENLRRRFEQNQDDCTFTVLALLPTATDNILEALPVESITHELQQQRQARLGPNAASPSELSSNASGEDGRSLSSFQTGSFVHASQTDASTTGGSQSPRPQKTKAQLWNELKISSITRSLTLIYTLALLTMFTRIQLNLLGRRSYVLSVVALASQNSMSPTINLENDEESGIPGKPGNGFETNRQFLAFSWWLLHRGWREIATRVERAVEEVFGPINPREEVSFERLAELVLETRRKVEGASEEERGSQMWLPFVLPGSDQEEFVLRESGVLDHLAQSHGTPQESTSLPAPSVELPEAGSTSVPRASFAISSSLRGLLDESSDIVDSPRFTHVLTRLLDTLFSELVETAIRIQAYRLPDAAVVPSGAAATSDLHSAELKKGKVKLANVLAVITRQAHAIGNGMPNVYVDATKQVQDLESLAVVIFSSDFDLEEIQKTQLASQSILDEALEDPEKGEPAGDHAPSSTWGMFETVWQKVAG